MDLYQYFLVVFTVVVITEIIFSVIIRPYYVAKIFQESISVVSFPEVSIEAFILLTIVFGIAFGRLVNVHPFLFLGSVFLIYGFASLNKKFSFYVVTFLLFNFFTSLSYRNQMRKQRIVITCSLFIGSALFLIAAFIPSLQSV